MTNDEWKALRGKANQLATEQYASEASDIAKLTKKQVQDIISESGVDKQKIADLVLVVNDSTKTNNQKAAAIKNVTGLAEVAASLIGKLL